MAITIKARWNELMNELAGLKIWQEKMREMAESGFIPYAIHMKAMLPKIKHDNWSAIKCNLEEEGYVFKEDVYGWLLVTKPDPKIQKRKNEIQKKMEELSKKLKGLEDEFKSL